MLADGGERGDVVHVERIELRDSSRSPVSYLPIRVLRRKRRYIQAVALLIPRIGGQDDLALKLECFDAGGRDQKRQEISLTHNEIGELLAYIHVASAFRDQPAGSYAVLRLGGTDEEYESSSTVAALASLLGNPKLAAALRQPELAKVLAESMNDAMRIGVLRSATNQLEILLNSGEVLESKYQDWLEEHTWALGNMYVRRDTTRRVSAADDVDILVESALNGLRDVYELKRPNMQGPGKVVR